MNRFLINNILFISVLLLSFYAIFCLADGRTDEYYLKFTSSKQSSLIIGSSRAAQGLQPKILNAQLFETDIYNYSFSIEHTPYGKAYFNSIKRKLISETKNGVFILEVNPWTVSSQTVNPEDSLSFKDSGSFIEKVSCVDCKPNLEYLVYGYDFPYRNLIQNPIDNNNSVHVSVDDDGWCRVEYLDPGYNFVNAEKRTIARYQLRLQDYSGISNTRLYYLAQTIEFLQEHGTVYLVRLPITDAMLDIEHDLVSDFDLKMIELGKALNVNYLNFIPDRYNYTYIDGHHLDFASGERISKYIVEHIINNKTL